MLRVLDCLGLCCRGRAVGTAGSAVTAGTALADSVAGRSATVRGTGATTVVGPRGGTDRALRLPGGAAGSSAAFAEIAPGLTTAATTDTAGAEDPMLASLMTACQADSTGLVMDAMMSAQGAMGADTGTTAQ